LWAAVADADGALGFYVCAALGAAEGIGGQADEVVAALAAGGVVVEAFAAAADAPEDDADEQRGETERELEHGALRDSRRMSAAERRLDDRGHCSLMCILAGWFVALFVFWPLRFSVLLSAVVSSGSFAQSI
jgi:hypothetical protein